jgi:hypothetical protein
VWKDIHNSPSNRCFRPLLHATEAPCGLWQCFYSKGNIPVIDKLEYSYVSVDFWRKGVVGSLYWQDTKQLLVQCIHQVPLGQKVQGANVSLSRKKARAKLRRPIAVRCHITGPLAESDLTYHFNCMSPCLPSTTRVSSILTALKLRMCSDTSQKLVLRNLRWNCNYFNFVPWLCHLHSEQPRSSCCPVRSAKAPLHHAI